MDIQEITQGFKNVYIYGGGVLGLAFLSDVRKKGIRIAGIIDRRGRELVCGAEDYNGIPIYEDIEELGIKFSESIFAITSTNPQTIREIAQKIEEAGAKYFIVNDGKSVYIDISGVCNLRCKSCQVCNHDKAMYQYTDRGFMSPLLYEKIIAKIKREIPDNKSIYLYNTGDPLLNKECSQIIEITHKYGMYAIISTNLSMEVDLDSLIKANPDCIKVSLSGFNQEIYSTTHNGGNVELVKKNLLKIKELIAKYNATTNIIIGYHLYVNNSGSEQINMVEFCRKCGFIFQSTTALYANPFKRWKLTDFSKDDIEFINTYYEYPNKILDEKVPDAPIYECGYLDNGLFIDYDGKMLLCCVPMHKDAIYTDYLSSNMDEINQKRRSNWICHECMRHGANFI
ncbi:MAG: radical SAM protein [Lachnospiraceae bacterium]|nr:radical SAM protein [Lachnospiraceae bacterium]